MFWISVMIKEVESRSSGSSDEWTAIHVEAAKSSGRVDVYWQVLQIRLTRVRIAYKLCPWPKCTSNLIHI